MLLLSTESSTNIQAIYPQVTEWGLGNRLKNKGVLHNFHKVIHKSRVNRDRKISISGEHNAVLYNLKKAAVGRNGKDLGWPPTYQNRTNVRLFTDKHGKAA